MDTDKFKSITELFTDDFTTAYRKIKAAGKNRLVKYLSAFFRRWYYSSLIENTILTPANLLEKLRGGETFTQAEPVMVSRAKIGAIDFKFTEYSLSRHPVVGDLQILLESCVPDIALTPDNTLSPEDEDAILERLSIYDPFYADYLIDVAFEMKLLKKITSIYSNRAQITEAGYRFLNESGKDALNKIFNASLDISCKGILEVLPLTGQSINREFILNLLKEPRSTDEIFQKLYYAMGVNIEDFFDMGEGNFDENGDPDFDDMYGAMMSSTFYLGVIIDKCFYTIYGYYLKLINPGYIIPCDMDAELEYAMDALDNADDISVGMFSPCSQYSLTKLGLEMFGVAASPANTVTFPETIPTDLLIAIAVSNKNTISKINAITREMTAALNGDGFGRPAGKIYEIKMKLNADKKFWKTIELPEDMTLDTIFIEIAYEFGFDTKANYSFFPNLDENPFSAYTAPANKRRSKKAADAKLKDLELKEHDKFALAVYDCVNVLVNPVLPQKCVRLTLELTKFKEPSLSRFYPQITRISQAFKDLEFDDDWI